jgi:hypothetical protein
MALPKKILLFAPCAFNLAETTRMVEIAKAVERHPKAREALRRPFHLRRRVPPGAFLTAGPNRAPASATPKRLVHHRNT